MESQLTDLPVPGAPAASTPDYPPARPVSHLAPGLVLAVVAVAVMAVILALSAGHSHTAHAWNAAVPLLIGILVRRRLAWQR